MKKSFIFIYFIIFTILYVSFPNKYISADETKNPEKISLGVYIVDLDATIEFNNYYNNNPDSTFNVKGELLNPYIVPSGLVILGVFDMNIQRPSDISDFEFVAIKKGGLDVNHVRDVQINQITFDISRSQITFFLDAEDADTFYKLTSAYVGYPLAIIFENKIKAIATIMAPIKDHVSIQGLTEEETNAIAFILKTVQ